MNLFGIFGSFLTGALMTWALIALYTVLREARHRKALPGNEQADCEAGRNIGIFLADAMKLSTGNGSILLANSALKKAVLPLINRGRPDPFERLPLRYIEALIRDNTAYTVWIQGNSVLVLSPKHQQAIAGNSRKIGDFKVAELTAADMDKAGLVPKYV